MGICGFALCLMITTCLWRASIQGEHQRRLYRDLMKDYNPLERPVFNDTRSLTVNFSFSLMQVMDVDEKNQVLTTNIWLQLVRRTFSTTLCMEDNDDFVNNI